MTVGLDHLDHVIQIFQDYGQRESTSDQLEKVTQVDTVLLDHEWNDEELRDIALLAPF